jgi:hypothetical protein
VDILTSDLKYVLYDCICMCNHCLYKNFLCTDYYTVLTWTYMLLKISCLEKLQNSSKKPKTLRFSWDSIPWHVIHRPAIEPLHFSSSFLSNSKIIFIYYRFLYSKNTKILHGIHRPVMEPLHHSSSFFCQIQRLFLYIIIFNIQKTLKYYILTVYIDSHRNSHTMSLYIYIFKFAF